MSGWYSAHSDMRAQLQENTEWEWAKLMPSTRYVPLLPGLSEGSILNRLYKQERGTVAAQTMVSIKRALDPHMIMNPKKLFRL